MNYFKIKWVLAIVLLIILLSIATSVFATNEEIQIVKKSDNEYMIYLKECLSNDFKFAFSNDKTSDSSNLIYQNAARDTNDSNGNYIAYIDSDLFNAYFSKNTYLWVKTNEGKTIVSAILVDLNSAITENEIQEVNTLTKRISVDTTQVYEKTEENVDGVKVTKTVGKIVVKESGNNEYQLIKVQESGDIAEFAKLITQISDGKVENNYYTKLELAKELSGLYNKLIPVLNDKNWKTVENNEILQPEDAKENDKYIVWLKNKNGEIKRDAQLLTSFEDYKPEIITEKVVSKLPVTADDPTLFILLGVLIVITIMVIIAKIVISKKEKIGE